MTATALVIAMLALMIDPKEVHQEIERREIVGRERGRELNKSD